MTATPAASTAAREEVSLLVKAAAAGDQQAWDRLVDRFAGFVLAVARAHRLSDHDAADVAQTTWLRVLEHLYEIRDPARIGGWIATTARRESLRVLRAHARVIPADNETFDRQADVTPLDARLMRAERDSELTCAFSRLPPRDRALLRLLSAEPSPSYEEIGAALGMPVGSIGPTRRRCLERLRRELGVLSPDVRTAA